MALTIAIIIGTTRAQRFSDKPARWIFELAAQRTDLTPVLLDLRDHPLPFFAEEAPVSQAPPRNAAALEWARLLGLCDGFIFVTGEYNHGIPAVLKNALDYALAEWARKPAAFFGYGGVGAARCIEQLRAVCSALQMAPLSAAVHVQGPVFNALSRGDKTFADYSFIAQSTQRLLDQLAWWARALKAARETQSAGSGG